MYGIAYLIPRTRIESYQKCVESGQIKGIKSYVLKLLADCKTPLSTRQISEVSGIEIGSLTAPINKLAEEGRIQVAGKTMNKTNRVAQTYALKMSCTYIIMTSVLIFNTLYNLLYTLNLENLML